MRELRSYHFSSAMTREMTGKKSQKTINKTTRL
jgi:hypothetical protein